MVFRKKTVKIFLFQLGFSIFLFLSGLSIIYFHHHFSDHSKITSSLNNSIQESENLLQAKLVDCKNQFLRNDTLNSAAFLKAYKNEFQNNGLIFLAYKKDSLVSWSDNHFIFSNPKEFVLKSSSVVYGGNGYYLVTSNKSGAWTFFALQLMKHEYRFNNDYLPTSFENGFHAPEGTGLSLKPSIHNITNSKGDFLFSLTEENPTNYSMLLMLILFTLFVTSFMFLISALFTAYLYIMRSLGHRPLLLLFFLFDVIIIRAAQFYFRFPSALYELELFNPVYFAASEWLPSLGDFLINALLFTQVIYYYFKFFPDNLLKKCSANTRRIYGWAAIFSIILLYHFQYTLLKSLILNSSIPLEFYNITSLTIYSVAALFTICLIMLSFIMLSEKIIHIAFNSENHTIAFYLGSALLPISYLLWLWFIKKNDPLPGAILIGILFTLYLSKQRKLSIIKSGHRVILLLLLALMGTSYINTFIGVQEIEKRKIIATHLSESRDKLAEYYYKNTQRRIKTDFRIPVLLEGIITDPAREPQLLDYIKTKYFQGFWSKFHVQLTLCHTDKKLNINPGNIITDCDQYFQGQISQFLSAVDTSGLYYLNQSIDQTYYLGKLLLNFRNHQGKSESVSLFVEINSKNANKGLGYPELLMDKSSTLDDNISSYSYAFYNRNELIRSVGKFSYSIEAQFNQLKRNEDYFFRLKDYSHLVHWIDSNKLLILSREEPGIADSLAPFSYLFLTLLLLLAFMMLIAGKMFIINDINLTFRLRLQIFMISIILISSMIIGTVTLVYLNQLNYNKNKDIVNEKMNTVLVELENKYGNALQFSDSDREELLISLVNLSNTNFTDINLFGLNGDLLASSRSQIFDEGLISTYMNPSGLDHLISEKQSFFIQREKIGDYNFLSAYAPLRNFDNKILGYLNLPYFSRQEDLRQEMSRLLATYANLYILMIAMAVLLAVMISRYITRPLQLIREKLGRFKLGETNQVIEWKRQDEIGDLVHEYNRMIDELAQSAERLAKSEREIAWREMARQVAHEIKNPLTPIKLSMQHLIKAWDDKAPDWESRLKRFSQTLIMQIETLSAIASEFSDFAQMPRSNYRTIDLQPIISSAVQLFKDAENVSIYFPAEKEVYLIYADENQMLRVFNNLLKNAIQALPAERKGSIRINLSNEQDFCKVTLSDNGIGIPTEQQARIFSPNFTTKSAGTGLGLAMVKNIIDNTHGEIWFESDEKTGTTFFILLPRFAPLS